MAILDLLFSIIYKKKYLGLLQDIFEKNELVDHKDPSPPYYLKAEDLFVQNYGKEIFIKKLYSISKTIQKRGTVILAPGIATNGNIYRVTIDGELLTLDHNKSFANFLAAEGFTVYIYNPGYTERIYNRYVSKYCSQSIYFNRRYSPPSDLNFTELVDLELPMLINFVEEDSGDENLSWIGYSLGCMLMYSYLSRQSDDRIKNIVSIGSPISLNQMFIKIVPFANALSKALGFEETALLGALSENIVPLTRLIRILPSSLIQYNPFSFIFFNPRNMFTNTVKALLGKIIEPIPSGLEQCFSNIIHYGFTSKLNYTNYLVDLRRLRKINKNFLFFLGESDTFASPDSVCLAHEIISPNNTKNLLSIPSTGHLDLIIGKNAFEKVWLPSIKWLKEVSNIN
ncbi:MAG: alpha/beta fold hydrolase [Desulfobacterales bacterium]|nr:alpha/beta fold hydrolase [Desulfobacterales bacterium]